MFSLIITIISIALVAALALATLYYGGTAFNKGAAQAEASKILLQGQQLLGAADLYFTDNREWPTSLEQLVTDKYLKQIPVAGLAPGDMLTAANAATSPWTMPKAKVPAFVLDSVTGGTEVCQLVNLQGSLKQKGILARAYPELIAQCFGPGAATTPFKAVFKKSAETALTDVVAAGEVAAGLVAAVVPADWTVEPGAVVGGGPGPVVPDPAGPVAPLFIDTSDLYFNVGTGLNSGVQFSMTNMGTTTLSYTFSISGDGFEVVPFGCEFPLDAGQTCQAAVGYTAAAGLGASTSKSAVLTVTTNEGVKTASVMATELGTCQLNRYMLNYGVSTYNGLNYANPLNHIGPYDYSNASAYARFLSEPNTTADSVTFQSGSDILSQYSSTVVTSGATRTRWAKTSDSSFGTAVDLYSYEASESMGPWVATGDYRGADRVVGNTNCPGDLAQPIPALPATAEGTGAVVFIGSQSQFIKRDPKSEIRVTAQVGWGERITYYPQYSTQNSQQANYVAAQINGACDIKSRNVAGMFGWVTSQLYLVCYNVDPASYAAFLANGTMTGNQAGFAAKFPRGVAASTGL